MNDLDLQLWTDLLIEIRRAKRAFLRSGLPAARWDALADGVRADFRAGVSIPRIARTVREWAKLISRPEPRAGYIQSTKE